MGRLAVKGNPCPVVPHGRAGVGVRSRFLDVAKGHARVEGGRDESVAQSMGTDRLVNPGAARHPAHYAPSTVAVHALAIGAQEDGPASRSPMARSTARAVRGARGHGYDLATLAQDGERAVAPLEPEGLDVGADSFRDPQAVQCQQRNERVLDRRPQPSRDEQGAHFVASRPMAWLSWSKRGRRTWTAGETGTSPSSSA